MLDFEKLMLHDVCMWQDRGVSVLEIAPAKSGGSDAFVRSRAEPIQKPPVPFANVGDLDEREIGEAEITVV